jgi:hypothetical protein
MKQRLSIITSGVSDLRKSVDFMGMCWNGKNGLGDRP